MSIVIPTSTVSDSKKVGLRPPFDPVLIPGLATFPPSNFVSIETIRNLSGSSYDADTFLTDRPDTEHKEYVIPGPEDNPNGSVTLSVFTLKASTSTKRPCFYNIHGGGQIAGNRFSALSYTAKLFSGIDMVLVSVEYRLAPEHRAPAALNDSYAGLVWTAKHAAELGIDPEKIIVSGASGGGPIAAACCIRARDLQYPKVCAQLLICPMLDDRDETVSSKQYEETGPWDGKTNRMAWECVLGPERGGPNVSELMSPSRATNLAGVAPAFIDSGGAEVFRDEDVAYASTLWKSGVSAELHIWAGGYHGYEFAAPETLVAKGSFEVKQAWIKRVLERD